MKAKMILLKTINRYFNYIFYPFFIITGLFILKLMLSRSSLFTTYALLESDYRNILDIYTLFFAIILLLKYFMKQLEEHKANVITLIKNNVHFIIINVIFFIMFFLNNNLEESILIKIKGGQEHSIILHILMYALSLYFIYSDYQEAYNEFKLIKQHESYTEILLDIIHATEGSVMHFLILCIWMFFAGKINLLIYLLHHIDATFLFIGITSALVFLALFIIHKRKKQL